MQQRHCPGALLFATGSISVTINGHCSGGHHASPRFKGTSDRFGFISYFLPSSHVCIARLVLVLTMCWCRLHDISPLAPMPLGSRAAPHHVAFEDRFEGRWGW